MIDIQKRKAKYSTRLWRVVFSNAIRISYLCVPTITWTNWILMVFIFMLEIKLVFYLMNNEQHSQKFEHFVNCFLVLLPWVIQYLLGPKISIFAHTLIWVFGMTSLKLDQSWLRNLAPIALVMSATGASYFLGEFALYEVFNLFCALQFTEVCLLSQLQVMGEFYEEKLAQRIARVDQDAKSRIVAIASHELRNPLQALSYLVSYLYSSINYSTTCGCGISCKHMEILDDMKATVDDLSDISDHILDFSKLCENRVVVQAQKLNSLDIVERVASFFLHRACAKDLAVYVDFDLQIPSDLEGDAVKLYEILSNLVANAIKYTPRGHIIISTTLVELRQKSVLVEYCVEDTGIGIAQQDSQVIFESFRQVSTSETCEHKGWGLGLSIVREFVGLMGGSISLVSKVGVGSKFIVRLEHKVLNPTSFRALYNEQIENLSARYVVVHPEPIAYNLIAKYLKGLNANRVRNGYVDGIPPKPNETLLIHSSMRRSYSIPPTTHNANIFYIGETEGSNSHKVITEPICMGKIARALTGYSSNPGASRSLEFDNLSVLLVEDNAMIHKLEKNFLINTGITNVHSAYDGQEALSELAKFDVDLILMDIMMPRLNGLDATKMIRSLPDANKATTPIIIVSGNCISESKEVFDSGANAVISKPINFPDLLEKIREVLNSKYSVKQ